MARKKGQRRAKSPHPGIVLLRRKLPSGRTTWRARYEDPVTGRTVYESLDKKKKTNDEQRRAWAIDKSAELQRIRDKLATGAPIQKGETLEDAIKAYHERKEPELRPATVRLYRVTGNLLLEWAKEAKIIGTDGLTPRSLNEFRAWVIRRRNTRTGAKLVKATVNNYLRVVGILLGDLRRMQQLPHLDPETIADGLRRVREPRNPPVFLRGGEIGKALEACIRHDRDGGTSGVSIAPFTVFLLLSGCRLKEAETLKWANVRLDDQEFEIEASVAKTGRGRFVSLRETPALARLLAAMKLRAEPDAEYVFGPEGMPRSTVNGAFGKLVEKYGAPPEFRPQVCRRTCATYGVNAPGVFGSASAYRSAKRLGHSVVISEQRYLGAVNDIDSAAVTLEAAMGVEQLVNRVIESIAEGESTLKSKVAGES